MLQKISFLRLRNAELLQLLSQILVLLTTANIGGAIGPLAERLGAVTKELDALHKSDPSSLITEELVEIDETRDDLYTGLLGHCRNLEYHNDERIAADGRALRAALNPYGDSETVTKQGYAAESTDIDSALADITRPELADAVARTGAALWTVPLAAANQLFKQRFLDRTEEKVSKELAFTMKKKREEAAKVYDELVRKINAVNELEGGEPIKALIEKIMMLTKEYRLMVRQRVGRAEAASAPAAPNA
ncbi:MAG: hypothetical protein EOO08_13425 [Chitinophagaceae bacterium]|nr:MAG: hypothetical protein EOO08_13425 [Chitinophagaceae bacterium]